MDAGTTSAYRNRKRPLDRRPCNPKVKRRLFPADVSGGPNRRAAEEMARSLIKRRRRVIAEAGGVVGAVADELCLLSEMGSYSRRELGPIYESIGILLSAMRACEDEAAEAPVEVRPDPYDEDDDDDSTNSLSPPPSFVENRVAAFVAVTHGDDTVRSKRRTKANSKYFGPDWTKK